jgi:CRP-like cAMP-binding protein
MVKADDLAAVTLFRDLDPDQLRELAAIAEPQRTGAHLAIFREGQVADAFFALTSGRVRVFKTVREDRCVTVRLVEPADTFGESALFADVYPSGAVTLDDACLLRLPRRSFRALLERRADLSMRLLATQTQRMVMLNHRIEELLLPVHLRLARLLLDGGPGLRLTRRGVVRLDISKRELASCLGAAPETLSRAFDQLTRSGLIRVSGRSIVTVNVAGLERLAASHHSEIV